MRINELAERAGVNPRTVRYYEQETLLPEPARTNSGYRSYSDSDVEALLFIKRAQRLGLSLDEIKEVIRLRKGKLCPCDHVQALLKQHVTMLERKIVELNSLKDKLETVLADSSALREQAQASEWCPIIQNR